MAYKKATSIYGKRNGQNSVKKQNSFSTGKHHFSVTDGFSKFGL